MNTARDVVITGLGVLTPVGAGRDAFWRSLQDGVSGVRVISQFDASNLPVRIGGELPDFDAKLFVKPRKSLKVMSHEIQVGVASATLAVEDANLPVAELDPDRFGVVFGSQMLYGELNELRDLYHGCVQNGEFQFARFGAQFPSQLFPLWMLKYLPNMTASHVAIAHNARGPNNSIVLGEASSLLAVMEAATLISRGWADVMLAGGGGSRLAITPLMFRGDVHLSRRNDDPAAASRPFDADRDGMVNAEGAGTLVLESRAHAESRGADILGVFAGWGASHCGGDPTLAGRQAAVERSLRQTLDRASWSAESVGHVNAHGLGTRDNDVVEAQAIREVCGDVPVTALKSYFGNLGAGGGAVELAASLLAARTGWVPPTLNYVTPDPECPVNVIAGEPWRCGERHWIKLSQSGTGQAVAVAIRS